MSEHKLSFDHIHLVSEDPLAAARWYERVLGGEIKANYEIRNAPQISVRLGGMTLLIRGRRNGEKPKTPPPMKDFDDYSSHEVWGTDHFGYTYHGDLKALCEEIKDRGGEMAVEPWEFTPNSLICYVAAPDGVSIEIVQARTA